MKLLIPLGLLALISVIVLIIIYVIKPNYQQKTVSTTFMWKLSLKYKKKRIPTSKIRNILIVLCQVAILTCFALIIAHPVSVEANGLAGRKEVVAIIDSSASMRTASNEVTRFERAVTEVKKTVDGVLGENGYASVIIADEQPYFLFERYSSENTGKVDEALTSLKDLDKYCSYGTGDSDAAISLCDSVLAVNHEAEIYYYTDVTFKYVPDGVKVIPVQNLSEWNAAILGAEVEMIDNFCAISVDVASYNRDCDITLNVNVEGANGEDDTRFFSTKIRCSNDATQRILFINRDTIIENELPADGLYYPLTGSDRLYSYKSIFISLSEKDNYEYDNVFCIYGGEKPVVKVQYTSTLVNNFVNSALLVLQNYYQNDFDLQISEVKLDNHEIPEKSGFDFYIYEHWVPEVIPADGVVFFMDPPASTMPSGADFIISDQVNSSGLYAPLTSEANSPLLHNVKAGAITVSRYSRISNFVGYDVLLSCDTYPMLLLRDEGPNKMMVMPFSVHYSNFGNNMYFPLFMHNVFEYFFPVMTDGFVFEVGESLTVNGRGENVKISGANNREWTLDKFPAQFIFGVPGTYEVSQTTYYQAELSENVFVKIPSSESNICSVENALRNPVQIKKSDDGINDLLIWFAAALIALLFIDWLLQVRSNV